MYHQSKIDLSIIKKHVVNSYKKINSLLIKVVTMTDKMKKNKTKIKKTDNKYLIALQKLNNRVMLKLITAMKKAAEISNENSDNN